MALQSQAPRAGSSRRYTTSTRRSKKGLAPWLVLAGVVVILVGLYVLFGGGEDPTNPTPAGTNTGNKPTGADLTAGNADRPTTTPPAGIRESESANVATIGSQPPTRPVSSPPTTAPPTIDNTRTPLRGEAKDQYENGMKMLETGDYVTGRAILSGLLFTDGALPRHEAQALRERLAFLSGQTVFSAKNRSSQQIRQDPILSLHKVQSGEYLSTIGNTYRTPYQLIERINGIKARSLQAGQGIQVINGPVHARIDKSDYRMDLYVVDSDGLPIYLKSYVVGLGEFDSTPIGTWRIKPGSKVGPANGGPSWRNPRTGQVYDRNDPNIPIGEYWMALEGTDENTKDRQGYGIHATNDPASIGRQESMGCIRMRDDDVDEVFYTLFEGASVVEIVP